MPSRSRNIILLAMLFAGIARIGLTQSSSFGNTFIHQMGESVIFGMHDFDQGSNGVLPGIVGTERTNTPMNYGILGFSDVAPGWTGIGDDSFVDGYVKKYGPDGFVFPIGDNGKFRPIASSGGTETIAAYYKEDPANARTSDLFGGEYIPLPVGGPFPQSSRSNLIVEISQIEYWDIDGSEPTTITLTWDIFSEIDDLTDNDLNKLSIVGWDGSKWVPVPSEFDFLHLNFSRSTPVFTAGLSNFVRGSITTVADIIPDDYIAYSFGAVASGSIGDFVWEDMNRNGIQELGEPGIEGIPVELYLYENDSLVQSTTTGDNGRYLFSGLPAETYYLKFYPSDGYAPTLPFQGASSKNSDVTFESTIAPFILQENEKKFGIDAGYYRTGSIGNYVWNDENLNGIQDNDESGVSLVRVELYAQGEDELRASSVTNADGLYTFTNVAPDFYIIKIIPPLNHAIGPKDATFDDDIDSDINPFTSLSDPIEVQSGYNIENIDAALSLPCLYTSEMDVLTPTCGLADGSIQVIIDGINSQTFRYEWNTGDSTAFVENVDSGYYAVLVRDETSCTQALEVTIEYEDPCELECVDIEASAFLEGSFVKEDLEMYNKLNDLGYLPGQRPVTFLGTYTPAGHPYDDAPWHISTPQGLTFESNSTLENNMYYDDDVVDWVLVSLRYHQDIEFEVCSRPALLHQDGSISYVDDDCCLVDPNKEYYVVVEHRNHLIVMSPNPQPVVNGSISFDFRENQSFRRLLGYGQKEVEPGVFVMYAGNGDQYTEGESSVDINANDFSEWIEQNGDHSSYYKQDYDLNGDANVQDKGMYLKNIGIFTDVPKGN